MLLDGIKIGFALTGSFCTFSRIIPEIEKIRNEGADITPIMSEASYSFDTRFGTCVDWKTKIEGITSQKILSTIVEVEPIGPKNLLDIMVVAPCTGNTLAKLANAITDTSVTMASKAHLRNGKPLVLAVSTNDGLGANAKNLGVLLNTKNIYFVPFEQDDPLKKCNSVVAKLDLVVPTIIEAMKGRQIQPILFSC